MYTVFSNHISVYFISILVSFIEKNKCIILCNFYLENKNPKQFSEKFKKIEAEMCLAMCSKKQEFEADCVYKLDVYKKRIVYTAIFLFLTPRQKLRDWNWRRRM